jgi:hypothetical protein
MMSESSIKAKKKRGPKTGNSPGFALSAPDMQHNLVSTCLSSMQLLLAVRNEVGGERKESEDQGQHFKRLCVGFGGRKQANSKRSKAGEDCPVPAMAPGGGGVWGANQHPTVLVGRREEDPGKPAAWWIGPNSETAAFTLAPGQFFAYKNQTSEGVEETCVGMCLDVKVLPEGVTVRYLAAYSQEDIFHLNALRTSQGKAAVKIASEGEAVGLDTAFWSTGDTFRGARRFLLGTKLFTIPAASVRKTVEVQPEQTWEISQVDSGTVPDVYGHILHEKGGFVYKTDPTQLELLQEANGAFPRGRTSATIAIMDACAVIPMREWMKQLVPGNNDVGAQAARGVELRMPFVVFSYMAGEREATYQPNTRTWVLQAQTISQLEEMTGCNRGELGVKTSAESDLKATVGAHYQNRSWFWQLVYAHSRPGVAVLQAVAAA